MDAKLDRIDELMQKSASLMTMTKKRKKTRSKKTCASAAGQLTDCRHGPSRSADTLPVICYLVWLFVKLQRLSRDKSGCATG